MRRPIWTIGEICHLSGLTRGSVRWLIKFGLLDLTNHLQMTHFLIGSIRAQEQAYDEVLNWVMYGHRKMFPEEPRLYDELLKHPPAGKGKPILKRNLGRPRKSRLAECPVNPVPKGIFDKIDQAYNDGFLQRTVRWSDTRPDNQFVPFKKPITVKL